MRVQIEELTLLGTSRTVRFTSGVNAIIGGMSGGKTATVSCLRALLGADVNVVPELSGRSISGTVRVGERRFRIVRRLVTTSTAKVDIAEIGTENAWRLPASEIQAGYDKTFRSWWLEMLGLPSIRVPQAPTKEASPLVPVTINDYLMYCVLRQHEIDSSVFGTPENNDKNIKRRYVFEILYGIYSPEAAGLRERLRHVTAELNILSADTTALERILADTPFSSQAQLQLERETTAVRLEQINREIEHHASVDLPPTAIELRERVAETEAQIAETQAEVHAETVSKESLTRLHDQLIAQSRRLTRALIAERFLNDFEFYICPRCGTDVPDRGDDDTCRLCMQTPPAAEAPAFLASEQDRVIEQVAETEELITRSQKRLENLHRQRDELLARRSTLALELDRETQSYISDHVDRIRTEAAEQATLREHLARIEDALKLYQHLDDRTARVASLERERENLIAQIDASRHSDPAVNSRLAKLDEAFDTVLRDFDAPRFDDQTGSRLDRRTYLPVVDGRPFTRLQSQGVGVLVNVAHVLAHQIVALGDHSVNLPNILIIDGISSNVGHEGVDLARLRNMYQTLLRIANEHIEDLQVIVTDNDPPPVSGINVALTLSDTDRFVPHSVEP